MERETKEIKDFDAKAFVEDCKKTLKLIDEEVKPLVNGDWQYGNESLTVSYSDRTESEEV